MADRTTPTARAYRSPKRERQAGETRRAILSAATEMFRGRGYAGTTIAAVAGAAGVSVPTVEAAFGTKAELLKTAIDVAIAGDDEPVPVLERPWAAKAQGSEEAANFLQIVAEVLVETQQRAGPLVLVAFEAARSDPRLEPLAAQLKAQRAITAGWIAEGVAART
ncbi:MAG: TetR/AcrR family transcriptional regulator, partial [Acidimicrobiales bacterium]